jgi:tRNA G18 (ribose-2'-O)-methylase SpoU
MRAPISLVGDGIENPGNAQAMMDAAGMFAAQCLFRDKHGLAGSWEDPARLPHFITLDVLAKDYSPLVAFDNVPGAADMYGFRLSPGPAPAVVVGNERRGIGRDVLAIARHKVQIPMFARAGGVNCLNVAAASAVALYYLSRDGGARLPASRRPAGRRPALMLVGGTSHVELGSAIRSAGAFGWDRLLLDDSHGVWFQASRSVKAEGRAAARRHRNPIRLSPASTSDRYAFAEVCVVRATESGSSMPLHRTNLAKGPQQLLVIPDESAFDVRAVDWHRLGKQVSFAHLEIPSHDYAYHYRLTATIALAEAARQVGRQAAARRDQPASGKPFYESALAALAEAQGETVYLEELQGY